MKCSVTTLLLLLFSTILKAQDKTDLWLDHFIRNHASPFLRNVLNKPDSFRYQFIYTQIDRDAQNKPRFTNYYLHVNRDQYFNPASMVKMPVALAALEKINKLRKYGITRNTAMLTDSAYDKQTKVGWDSTAPNGFPSVAHYIRKIFIVSDNDAYNRLYEFVGQQTLNQRLWQLGYKDARITRRFVSMNEDQNRHTNPIRFFNKGQLLYAQPAANSKINFDFSKKIMIGNAHLNRNDSLIAAPMDFTTHNNFPLEDLQKVLQSAIFPRSVPPSKRFQLTASDYAFLHRCMSQLPAESEAPVYDPNEYFDSYTKFFLFKAGKSKIPDYIRVFNKTGWSYGFLTDVAYIVDFKHKVEFMLSGTIYTNSDGVLNDDKYEYETIGYPWFREMGNIMYQYELARKRNYTPNLNEFIYKYRNDEKESD